MKLYKSFLPKICPKAGLISEFIQVQVEDNPYLTLNSINELGTHPITIDFKNTQNKINISDQEYRFSFTNHYCEVLGLKIGDIVRFHFHDDDDFNISNRGHLGYMEIVAINDNIFHCTNTYNGIGDYTINDMSIYSFVSFYRRKQSINMLDGTRNWKEVGESYYEITNLSSPPCRRQFLKNTGNVYPTNEYRITFSRSYNLSELNIKKGDFVKFILNTNDGDYTYKRSELYAEVGMIDNQNVYFRINLDNVADLTLAVFNEFSSIEFFKCKKLKFNPNMIH